MHSQSSGDRPGCAQNFSPRRDLLKTYCLTANRRLTTHNNQKKNNQEEHSSSSREDPPHVPWYAASFKTSLNKSTTLCEFFGISPHLFAMRILFAVALAAPSAVQGFSPLPRHTMAGRRSAAATVHAGPRTLYDKVFLLLVPSELINRHDSMTLSTHQSCFRCSMNMWSPQWVVAAPPCFCTSIAIWSMRLEVVAPGEGTSIAFAAFAGLSPKRSFVFILFH